MTGKPAKKAPKGFVDDCGGIKPIPLMKKPAAKKKTATTKKKK